VLRAEQHHFGVELFYPRRVGLVRVMPYKAHLAIDTIGGRTALAAPWVFGFAKNRKARKSFLVLRHLVGLLTGLLSQPDEMPKHPKPLVS
jgi:hypothetical protein